MILPDVNVLVCAFRQDASQHAICQAWLRDIVLGDTPFGISPLSLAAVVRIATDHRIYKAPSPREDVLGFCEDILLQSHGRVVEPRDKHWEIFKRMCIEGDVRGKRITDAWYAALAIEWDCEWITFDRDYARFPGLKWRTPEAA